MNEAGLQKTAYEKLPKVLMIGPDRTVKGGISSVVNEYYKAGLDKEVTLTYLPSTIDGTKGSKSLFFIAAMFRFLKLVRRQDIVHIHMSFNGSYARKRFFARIARGCHKRVIVHIHSGAFDTFFKKAPGIIQRDIRQTLSQADRVIVMSAIQREKIADILDGVRVVVLPNAVNVPGPRCTGYADHNALFLGRITEEKGIYDLLYAWQAVAKGLPDAMLYVGGSGEVSKAMALCHELEIEDNVQFIGWVSGSKKEEYFEKSSVFILPSHIEAMPMCILEAMSYGLATVSTMVGSIPSMVSDGKEGILLPFGCPERLQSALCSLLKDEKRKCELGQNGYARIKEEFDLNVVKERLVDLYKALL